MEENTTIKKEILEGSQAYLNTDSNTGAHMPTRFENSKTLYIVDDDMDDRLFCQMHLKQSNWVRDIHVFESAADFFKYFETIGLYEFDHVSIDDSILLLDVQMPSINGMEALDFIRTHPVTTDMCTIMLTSNLSSDQAYEAYKLQANGYLQKPFSLTEFDKILSKRQQHKNILKN